MAEQFNPDAYLASVGGTQTPLPSPTPVDQTQIQQFDPDNYINQKESERADAFQAKYGTPGQQALAGVEAFGRGASLGATDYLAPLYSSPEDVRSREAANPFTSFGGSLVGGAALLGVGGALGVTGKLAEATQGAARSYTMGQGVVGPLTRGAEAAAHIAQSGIEGAVFGAGNANSDYALGDPDLNAQKIIADVGFGTALGGGIGMLSKALGALPAMLRRAPKDVPVSADVPGEPIVSPPIKPSSSLQEMKDATENIQKYGGQSDILQLPQKQIAVDAAAQINPELGAFGINDYQLGALDSQDNFNDYKRTVQFPGEEGTILRNHQAVQKQMLGNIVDQSISSIAKDYEPTADAMEAASRLQDHVNEAVNATQESLKPAMNEIKGTRIDETDHVPGLIDYLTNPESSVRANPKISNMFDKNSEEIAFHPYDIRMGIDKATYGAVKEAVESLDKSPADFENLFDIRKGMKQKIPKDIDGDAFKEITNVRAAMMDYIQDNVQKVNPSLEVRDTFRKWAQNEDAKTFFKQKGIDIESQGFRGEGKGSAQDIMNKVFKDPESIQALKNLLPEENFNKVLSDRMAILKGNATKDNVFSSKNFASALEREKFALRAGFGGNPLFDKIKSANTLIRLFPDVEPANPSKSTQTFFETILKNGIDPVKQMGTLYQAAKEKVGGLKYRYEVNQKLAGLSDANVKLKSLGGIADRVGKTIESGARSLFGTHSDTVSGAMKGAALSAGTSLSDKAYDKITHQINTYYSQPETLLNDMASNTEHMHTAAPNITSRLQQTMMNGISYLKQKMPIPPMQSPLAPPWKPSIKQRNQFEQHFKGVDNPLGVFASIKNGTLSNNEMEAIQTVHPQLLQGMQKSVLSHIGDSLDRARSLPYTQKLALSKFLNQPLDSNMTPMGVMNNQMALQSPNLSQQTSQAGKTTLGGLKQLDLAGRAATQTSRRREEV